MSGGDRDETEVVSPNGWAVVGSFLGVLIGYTIGIGLSMLTKLGLILIFGIVGAYLAHEAEFQVMKRTNYTTSTTATDAPEDLGEDKEGTDMEDGITIDYSSDLVDESDEVIMISSDSGRYSIYDPGSGAIGTGETKKDAIMMFAAAVEDIEESKKRNDFEIKDSPPPPWFNGGTVGST